MTRTRRCVIKNCGERKVEFNSPKTKDKRKASEEQILLILLSLI
jgi:hypothetical protein